MLIYKCPAGHRYLIGGHGEDLTAGIERLGSRSMCPVCKLLRDPTVENLAAVESLGYSTTIDPDGGRP